jgi:uncharacterized protein YdbL (DUF1318 family)
MQDRDPAYEAARASGKVGEKVDGYLGIVGASTPALDRIVADINIRRRAVYTQRAKTQNATINEYAISAGCKPVDSITIGIAVERVPVSVRICAAKPMSRQRLSRTSMVVARSTSGVTSAGMGSGSGRVCACAADRTQSLRGRIGWSACRRSSDRSS